MSNQYPPNPQQPTQQGPRFQVRSSAHPGGYYWEAFDTQAPQNTVMPPTPNRQTAQARADQLNSLAKPKKHRARNILLGVGAGLVVLIGAATAFGDPEAEAPVSVTSQATKPVDNGPTPDPITTPTNKPTPPAATTPAPAPKPTKTAPKLTASQEQAIGTAQDYLDYQSFSRKGLIGQLKFEGFSTKDATFAVDHLKVNWSLQAVGVAKGYLENQHFSRAGLIDQLEYEGFTHAQAVYGVNKAGL